MTREDPRIAESRRRILAAALDELAEVGYGAFTVESVARRGGVAKSTLYRHWPGKLPLVADAMRTLNVQPGGPGAEARSAGKAEPRLRVIELVRHLAEAFASSQVAACTPALVDAAARDPEVRDLFHANNAERRRRLTDAIEAGVRSGAFDPSTDAELASIALAGAVMYRRLMTPAPLDPDATDALVTTVLGPPRWLVDGG